MQGQSGFGQFSQQHSIGSSSVAAPSQPPRQRAAQPLGRHQSLVWCVGVWPVAGRSADRSIGTASSGSSTRWVAQLFIRTAMLQQGRGREEAGCTVRCHTAAHSRGATAGGRGRPTVPSARVTSACCNFLIVCEPRIPPMAAPDRQHLPHACRQLGQEYSRQLPGAAGAVGQHCRGGGARAQQVCTCPNIMSAQPIQQKKHSWHASCAAAAAG